MIDLDQGLRRLAARTSRRGVLAKMGAGLVGAALYSMGMPQVAHADSCTCSGQLCNGLNCGDWGTSGNSCCVTPCTNCGGGAFGSGNCADPFPNAGWYWFCCVNGPGRPEGIETAPASVGTSGSLGISSPNVLSLWKCQDCCGSGGCKTFRSVVGSC
jgi:hypothetical protein